MEIVMSELARKINKDLNGEYGIGLHSSPDISTCEKIKESGLLLKPQYRTVLGNTVSLGVDNSDSILAMILNDYKYGVATQQCNVIIASPQYISNSQGESLFLGYPPFTLSTTGNQYQATCIFDEICRGANSIPPEMIYGYYCNDKYYSYDGDEENIEVDFTENTQHFSKLSQQEKDEVFERIKGLMNRRTLDISKLTAEGNVEKLIGIREICESFKAENYVNLINISLGEIEKRRQNEVKSQGKIAIDDCIESETIREDLVKSAIEKVQEIKEVNSFKEVRDNIENREEK